MIEAREEENRRKREEAELVRLQQEAARREAEEKKQREIREAARREMEEIERRNKDQYNTLFFSFFSPCNESRCKEDQSNEIDSTNFYTNSKDNTSLIFMYPFCSFT
jgi:hypothetical protein